MKLNIFFASGLLAATAVSAFQPPAMPSQRVGRLSVGTMMNTIDVQETAARDVYSVQEWAQNYGVQMADGFEITTQDGEDYSVITNQNIAAGSPVLFVPAELVISSENVVQEFGGNLQAAENTLTSYEGTAQRLPLFRLMVKILAEYEKGADSPYLTYLNAMPRRFYNGAAMTDACFECLPPYAAYLAMNERNAYSRFVNAIRNGYVPLQQETMNNDVVVKWAYNVALTRFNEVWQPVRDKKLAPLADMFNHNTNPNVEVTYDQGGNCMATAMYDIPAGSPLTVSLGDPTNPTPLFAKYGFLYNDCTTIFCKAMHLTNEIEALGYEYKDLLFQTESGEISPKVWDIFLYNILQQDPDAQGQFYVACKTNDEDTKQGFHGQYFQYTLEALKAHVGSILQDIDNLTMKAQSYDLNTHPRVPVIVAHNNLVRETFIKVNGQLNSMG